MQAATARMPGRGAPASGRNTGGGVRLRLAVRRAPLPRRGRPVAVAEREGRGRKAGGEKRWGGERKMGREWKKIEMWVPWRGG